MSASLSLFDKEHTAREKYIYFICGVASALVAYLGKDYTPSHPWTIHDKLNISTLICLVVSFLFGVGRILCYIQGISINKDVLVAQEEIGNFVNALTYRLENKDKGVPISINKKNGKPYSTEEIQARIVELTASSETDSTRMKKRFKFSQILFVICHVFLILGFILMICAKLAA
ncbi:MAG: hypothetical protein WBW41_12260 [Verrucomicrobiia bacterium]